MTDPTTRPSRSVRPFWLASGLLIVVVTLFTFYVRAEKQIDHANETRLQSILLAGELRQSSDDLTRMVRAYVLTGDTLHKRHYEEILAVREGRAPRPLDAHNVYWDLVLSDDRRPRASGPAVPLLDLMRRAGFTEREFALLKEAKKASDALTRTEYEAMALIELTRPPTPENRLRAAERLNDDAYRRAKSAIMRPIGAFSEQVAARTDHAVVTATAHAAQIRWLLILASASLMAVLGLLLAAISREKRAKGESEALIRAVFDNAAVGLAKLSPEGRYLQVNQELCRLTGYSQQELVDGGMTFQQLTFPQDRASDMANLERLVRGEKGSYPTLKRYVRKDGRVVWVSVFANAVREGDGQEPCFVSAVIDVTEKKRLEEDLRAYQSNLEQIIQTRTAELYARNDQLRRETEAHEQMIEALMESESRFRFITENTRDVIWMLDLSTRRFTYMSPAVERLRGYTVEEVMAQPMEATLTPESRERVSEALSATLSRWEAGSRADTVQTMEIDQPHKDGHIIHTEVITSLHADSEGRPTLILGVTRDITERKRQEEYIRRLAFHDPLTQLPNRRFLLDRLQEAMARARRDRSRVGLMFIDLDKFKPVNDELGHDAGDWLLQAVAKRMMECLRAYDVPSRFGGDEFVILLPGIHQAEDALLVAERVREALEQPFVMANGKTLSISSSIGIALYPDHAQDDRELLRYGDEAMYRAKSEGRNRVVLLGSAALGLPASGPVQVRLMWEPAYACGHPTIDQEHRDLFRLGNEVLDCALTAEEEPEAFAAALRTLMDHVARHFAHEEALLQERGYVRLEEHAALHQALLGRANALAEESGKGTSFADVIDFLAVEVVSRHLLTADRDYFPLFRETGVPSAVDTPEGEKPGPP